MSERKMDRFAALGKGEHARSNRVQRGWGDLRSAALAGLGVGVGWGCSDLCSI